MVFRSHMTLALEEARAAAARGEVPVGAVLIAPDGTVAARAGNRTRELNDPTAHAEILAIRAACAAAGGERLTGYDLYVTLEPCAMCAAAIAAARIARVYYGASDPKSGGVAHGACVFSHPQAHHVPEVYEGIAEADCAAILKEFFTAKRQGAGVEGHVKPPEDVLAAFRVMAPEWIATTAIASLWKVSRAGGGAAVLKYYGARGMGSEADGFRFLQAAPEDCAARVYGLRPDAALIEWLEGPSLADLAIAGEDETAARELVRVASGLHPGTGQAPEGYPRLEDRFDALFHLKPAPSCAAGDKAAIAACQTLACELLNTQIDVRPLHGDLHHGNVMKTPRGYCAFDAKGIVGERTYELANAFRHPYGNPDLTRDPRRIGMLADLWSVGFAVDRQRLLQWAAVKCALSIAWRSKGRLAQDDELDLLAALLSCATGQDLSRVQALDGPCVP